MALPSLNWSPFFFETMRWFTKNVKENYDLNIETMALRQDFNKIADVEMCYEADETFTSTSGIGQPKKTPEGQNIAMYDSVKWHTTVIPMLDKTTYGKLWSYEYVMIKNRDKTERFAEEYERDTVRRLRGMWDEMNREVYTMLNEWFSPTAKYPSPDLQPVFSANHKFAPDVPAQFASANTFSNLLTAGWPSEDKLDELRRRAADFKDLMGIPMPLNPNKILVKKGSKVSHDRQRVLFGTDYRTPTMIDPVNWARIWNTGEFILEESVYLTNPDAYFFLPDSFDGQGLTNPFYLGVMQYPTLWEWVESNANNMTYMDTMVSFYKVWLRHVPIGVYGATV